jgi:hypothetical protein
MRPPAEWFADPKLPRLTALTVEAGGRVYGHAFGWGTCHTGFPGECRTAPRGHGYAYFRLGSILCDDESEVAVGHITLDTVHAALDLGWSAASRHYGDTGCVVADIAFGDDRFGGWVAGALRPGVTETQTRKLRASPLSGDWRMIERRMEMVALLAVNAPGFPVPRLALAASGEVIGATGLGMLTVDDLIDSVLGEAEVVALTASLL